MNSGAEYVSRFRRFRSSHDWLSHSKHANFVLSAAIAITR